MAIIVGIGFIAISLVFGALAVCIVSKIGVSDLADRLDP